MSDIRIDILSRDDIDSYINRMSQLFGECAQGLTSKLLCAGCHKCPDVVNGFHDSTRPWQVIFSCASCPMLWSLCKHCGISDQPMTPSIRTKRMSKELRQDVFDNISLTHHDRHHLNLSPNSDSQYGNNEFIFHEDINIIDNNDLSRNECEDDHMMIALELAKADLFSVNNDRLSSEKREHILDMIVSKDANDSYADYLIKKSWIMNMDVTFTTSECNLFLRVVKELLLSSRDSNSRFMDIINMVQERESSITKSKLQENNRLNQELIRIKDHLNKVTKVIDDVGAHDNNFYEFIRSELGESYDGLRDIRDNHNSSLMLTSPDMVCDKIYYIALNAHLLIVCLIYVFFFYII